MFSTRSQKGSKTMPIRAPHVNQEPPGAEDLWRTWKYLTSEFVSDLRWVIEPMKVGQARAYVRVSILSQGFDDQHPRGYDYVWAIRDFPDAGYLISWDGRSPAAPLSELKTFYSGSVKS